MGSWSIDMTGAGYSSGAINTIDSAVNAAFAEGVYPITITYTNLLTSHTVQTTQNVRK